MPQIWPPAAIHELLALAERLGESRATLATEEDARLFRFAIYSFRKTHNVGQDLGVTLDQNTVIVRRRYHPSLVILPPAQQGAA